MPSGKAATLVGLAVAVSVAGVVDVAGWEGVGGGGGADAAGTTRLRPRPQPVVDGPRAGTVVTRGGGMVVDAGLAGGSFTAGCEERRTLFAGLSLAGSMPFA